MKYLLDSNVVSDLYDQESSVSSAILTKLSNLEDADNVFISVLGIYEFEYRYANAPNDMKPIIRRQIYRMREDFQVLPLYEDAAVIFGEIKKSLRTSWSIKSENMKKHNIDLMLAATAIVADATIISADKVFFELSRFHNGLHVEDWTV